MLGDAFQFGGEMFEKGFCPDIGHCLGDSGVGSDSDSRVW